MYIVNIHEAHTQKRHKQINKRPFTLPVHSFHRDIPGRLPKQNKTCIIVQHAACARFVRAHLHLSSIISLHAVNVSRLALTLAARARVYGLCN